MGIELTTGDGEVILVTKNAQAIRFAEEQIRPMGRQAQGVIGIRLDKGDEVVGLGGVVADGGADLLVVTDRGASVNVPPWKSTGPLIGPARACLP